MTVFADSSALVKLYADESGASTARAMTGIIVSQLVRVEVPAALWRKVRTGQIETDDAALLVADFEADYDGDLHQAPRFATVLVDGDLLDQAARLTAVHQLRGYDAVQLASAVRAASADPSCTTFAAFDVQLRAAAAAEGFALLPATL